MTSASRKVRNWRSIILLLAFVDAAAALGSFLKAFWIGKSEPYEIEIQTSLDVPTCRAKYWPYSVYRGSMRLCSPL